MQSDIAGKYKQFEKALRDSNGFYQQLVESVKAIPWFVDLSTWRFTYVGPQAVELLGYPLEAWYQENFWLDHLYTDDRDWASQYCQEAVVRGENHEFEYRLLAADGSVVWVRDRVTVVTDDNGPIALQGYMFDVTEHKLAEQIQARSKAELEAVFNAIPDAVVCTDTERCIIMTNPAVKSLFGYNLEELLGHTTEMLYADKNDFAEQGRRRFHVGADTAVAPYEVSYRRKDGSVFPGETQGTQVKDENGQTLGFIGLIRDITERKQAEETLRRQAKLIEQIHDSVVATDMEGYVTSWNKGAEQLFGYSASEMLGKHIASIYPEHEHEFLQQHVIAPLLEKGEHELETRKYKKSGEMFYAHLSMSLQRDHNGNPIGMIGYAIDVTERKVSEEKIRASEQELSTILNSMQDTYYRIDCKGLITRVSPSIQKLLGYSVHQLQGTRLIELSVEPKDRKRLLKQLNNQKGIIQNFETQLIHKEGGFIWVSVNAHYVRDEQGRRIGIEGTIRDVTQLKLAEDMSSRLGRILDNSSNEIYVFDADTLQFIQVNKGARDNLGYSMRELALLTAVDIKPDYTYEQFLNLIQPLLSAKQEQLIFETRHARKDGSYYPVEVRLQMSRKESPQVFVAIIQDITQRKQAEEQMRKLSGALEQTADSVIVTNPEGIIEYVNPAFEQITGYSSNEVIGKTPNILTSNLQDKSTHQRLWETILAGGVFRDILINRKKDGDLYYEEKTITPLKDDAGNIVNFISTGKDITERMQAQERLQYLAHHDALTALPNRVLFTDRLEQSLARARWHTRAVALLFLDLDRFKLINDTLGHDFGDRTLQALSKRLRGCVRDGDTVARLGGDEFAIVLEDIASADDVAPIARKILDVLAQPFLLDEREFFITTSIGISLYPSDGESSQSLLKQADIAMYRAKEQGRNTYQFYSADMGAKAFEHLALETSLRRALERQEFQLYYQPQVELNTGRVCGVEALLRWKHPELGLVSPMDFIPLLEETGLIVPVGEWVMRTACKQAQVWNKTILKPLRISVNLSGRQIKEVDFVGTVKSVLEETKLEPALLELEITESILLHNVEKTEIALEALSEMGIRLAVDDFGTGYSSLSYLKRFSIDTLKIDRSFIRDIPQDPDDATLVEAIIAMGRTLHLNVIAEGVETQSQVEFLHAHHCDGIQGYLFSRPLPEQELDVVLKKKPALCC